MPRRYFWIAQALCALPATWLALAMPAGPGAREPDHPHRESRTVYLGGELEHEDLVTFTSAVAASGKGSVVLLDGPKAGPYLRAFLDAYRPEHIVPVGAFPGGAAALENRLGRKTEPVLTWDRGRPAALWQVLCPTARRIVVCPASPRGQLLQAACLAGTLHAPLFVTHGRADETQELLRWLRRWHAEQVDAVGESITCCRGLDGIRVASLKDAAAVADRCVHELLQLGSIHCLVVANPADVAPGLGSVSDLAPWLALEHHAALLLTNEQGSNVEPLVRSADPLMADQLILAATLKAIPMETRPNPAKGKDTTIPMEPLTPHGEAPFSFATGRLFHEDPAVLALVAARQRLLREAPASRPRKALVVSNPGGGLPLLETFSRNTAQELRNSGYQTTALFEEEVNKDQVRRLVPAQDIFLWEGHYRTLVDEYGLPKWTEPLQPSLVFLQSCLALNEAEAQPLVQRGAVAVVGSPARMYSGSGGAFTLAFFDAMLYDGQSLGGALRQAKNFLLLYSVLKEERLAEQTQLAGANLRSAWAFTLWGDPTFTLPRPPRPADALPGVRPELRGRTIVFSLPAAYYNKVTTEKYDAQMMPNSRLAGLLTPDRNGEDRRHMVPFLFAEVPLPRAPVGHTLAVRCRLPQRHWTWNYDPRRRCLYLLVTPRPRDEREIRFYVHWDE